MATEHENLYDSCQCPICETVPKPLPIVPHTKTFSKQLIERREERLKKLSDAMRTILECVDDNPSRTDLLKTPERFAEAVLFFTKGYHENPKAIVNDALFGEPGNGLVVVKGIEFFSLCEHHFIPFSGKVHVGYLPSTQVIGLSKIARIVEIFSRRLQVQERLTKQIGEAVSEILQPQGVAVVIEATHLCMVMRGVEKSGAKATTSYMLGSFAHEAMNREEFYRLISCK